MYNECYTELYHHGILGMKWGVRRYQNKDGSLTRAGKKRVERLKYLADENRSKTNNITNDSSSYGRNGVLTRKNQNKVTKLKLENEQIMKEYESLTGKKKMPPSFKKALDTVKTEKVTSTFGGYTDPRNMSDADLVSQYNRLMNEKRLLDMQNTMNSMYNPSKPPKEPSAFASALAKLGTQALVGASTGAFELGKTLITRLYTDPAKLDSRESRAKKDADYAKSLQNESASRLATIKSDDAYDNYKANRKYLNKVDREVAKYEAEAKLEKAKKASPTYLAAEAKRKEAAEAKAEAKRKKEEAKENKKRIIEEARTESNNKEQQSSKSSFDAYRESLSKMMDLESKASKASSAQSVKEVMETIARREQQQKSEPYDPRKDLVTRTINAIGNNVSQQTLEKADKEIRKYYDYTIYSG